MHAARDGLDKYYVTGGIEGLVYLLSSAKDEALVDKDNLQTLVRFGHLLHHL